MKKCFLYPCVYGILAIYDKNKITTTISRNGKIEIKNTKNNEKLINFNHFLLRGFTFFVCGLYYTFYGIFTTNSTKKQKISTIEKASKSLNVSAVNVVVFLILVLSLIFSLLLLGYLPIKLSFYLAPKDFNMLAKRLIIALVKCLIIYAIFLILKYMPGFKTYLSLNTACAQQQKENGGVNFLEYFISSVFVCTIVLSLIGITTNEWYFILVNIFTTILIFTANYEVFKEIEKNKWLKFILAPINYLIYKNPSHLEKKCVKIALVEVELCNNKRNKMQEVINEEEISFSEAYVTLKEKLEKANKYEKSDLDYIFCEVLGKKRGELRLTKTLSKNAYKQIEKAVTRRALGEPVSKIFGHAEFYGLDFIVTKDVLSPRMDTERLVETVIKDLNKKSNVLEIGVGSGALSVTISKLVGCNVTGVDISDKALLVAKNNAKKHSVKVNFIKSDLFASLKHFAKFDAIVSNPPYIPTKDIQNLDEEVKNYDPILALGGGSSGLNFYEQIIDEAPNRLKHGGKIYFEVGIGQAQHVKKLLQKNFKDIRIVKDYNKIDRVVVATIKD